MGAVSSVSWLLHPVALGVTGRRRNGYTYGYTHGATETILKGTPLQILDSAHPRQEIYPAHKFLADLKSFCAAVAKHPCLER